MRTGFAWVCAAASTALIAAAPGVAGAGSDDDQPASNFYMGQNGLHPGENGGLVTPSTLAPAAVRPDAAAGLARAYGGAPISVTTFHYDNGRTGWNASETDLTPASGASRFWSAATPCPTARTTTC